MLLIKYKNMYVKLRKKVDLASEEIQAQLEELYQSAIEEAKRHWRNTDKNKT